MGVVEFDSDNHGSYHNRVFEPDPMDLPRCDFMRSRPIHILFQP